MLQDLVRAPRATLLVTALAAIAVASARPAHAEEDGWELTLSPYIWAVSLNGSAAARGNEADVDASFGDILDKSDSVLAFNADISLRKNRVGLLLGPSYSQLGVDDVADGTPAEADLTFDLLLLDLAATYRLVDWPMTSTGGGEDTWVTLDAYAGVRYTRLDAEIDFDQGGSPSADEDWWDPIIGAQSDIDLTPRWFLHFRGDVGGFGAGSDFTALGAASLGFRFHIFKRPAAVQAGYRALFQDYDEDSGAERVEWDMTIHGPTLGLTTFWG